MPSRVSGASACGVESIPLKFVYDIHAVNGKDGKGKAEGMVRVVNPVTGQRALIRGKSSEVLDLQFAHMKTQILLASIEDIALHIHKIETVKDSIICTLLLKIEDAVPDHVPKYDQINWCPYVPADETESDSYVGRLIVWTRGTSYQCYSVNAVVENYGVSILAVDRWLILVGCGWKLNFPFHFSRLVRIELPTSRRAH